MLMLFYQAFRSNSVFYAKMVSNFRRKVRGCEMLFLEVAEGMKMSLYLNIEYWRTR
jgi:hypothetical protein